MRPPERPSGPPPPPPPPPPTGKRKKWTEAEERTLLDKYAEMSADGSLTRLRTRERRFRPIANHVNSVHHLADPSTFPFLWSWKDASTKVQNMRHQYSLVKHKLLLHSSDSQRPLDPLSLWPNFHRYRDVFGDTPPEADDDDDDDDDNKKKKKTPPSPERSRGRNMRKRTRRKAWAVVREQIEALREREERLAEAEERARERARRRWRREEEEEREWEEQMERRRADWRRRMEGTMAQHRAEMEEMRARSLHDQQALLSQLLAVAGQWCGAAGFAPVDAGQHNLPPHHHHHQQQQQHQACCFSHMVVQQEEGFNHVVDGAIEQGEDRVGAGDSQEEGDQFIVDDDAAA